MSHTQDLSEHRWEDRLVLILTDDSTNATYREQLNELSSNRKGLEDRKLVIYSVLPDKYKRDDKPRNEWTEAESLFSRYKKDDDQSFEILLIGLDGGVKLRQNEFLPNKDLFARIDQMPMRRRELQDREENF